MGIRGGVGWFMGGDTSVLGGFGGGGWVGDFSGISGKLKTVVVIGEKLLHM